MPADFEKHQTPLLAFALKCVLWLKARLDFRNKQIRDRIVDRCWPQISVAWHALSAWTGDCDRYTRGVWCVGTLWSTQQESNKICLSCKIKQQQKCPSFWCQIKRSEIRKRTVDEAGVQVLQPWQGRILAGHTLPPPDDLPSLQVQSAWFSPHSDRPDRVLTLHKNGSCEITQWLFETFGWERSCVIEQEPFWGVRTHFYHDVSSYNMFRDLRVVEMSIARLRIGWGSWSGFE